MSYTTALDILAPTTSAQSRENRRAERVRREAELFGGCHQCLGDHPTYRCPEVAAERRRQEREETR
jgi:hypothetical protein